MSKTVRTMQGKEIDMEKLQMANELTQAVGNVKVNARGDELGPGGTIIKTREEIMGDFYKRNKNAVQPDDMVTAKEKDGE